MGKYSASNRSWLTRIAVGMGAVITAIGLWSPGAARADTFVPLPKGHIEGPGVKITSTSEHAVVSPSLAANGAGRTTWVSGDVTVDIQTPDGVVGPNNGAQNNAGTNDSSTHGASGLTVGYLVGCQVALGSFGPSLGATLSTSPTIAAGVSFPISPGEVKWVQIDNKDMTKSGRYFLNYQDVPMDVQGCAGYAQARQFAVVEVIGPDYHKVTLYGQPFSLG
ncbi:MspA family porin [Nocardia jiangxiensis]|uniref:MspA family porin n=1 Tax=Nocardia jiangxiensis TaxID=282685 RepID=UPI000594E06B|nr:MspA family porin [Nocardia jiangxiensis]